MADAKPLPTIPGYRLLRPIGAGGMGSVYEAEKLSTHETFAVKLIREYLIEDTSYVMRFEREVSALRAIRHPNVVDIFEWSMGDASGSRPYVVMELLEGESLDQFLRREKVMEPAHAVQVMLQVLEGLAAAHGKAVLHRDLGPSNIFLERRSSGKVSVKLLDFGLARAMIGGDAGRAVTQEGTLMGKPAYVAPELFHSQQVDERGDIFACGMNLYRMLTGRLPFRSTEAQMLWVERWAERESPVEYPSPQTFAPALPDPLARVVSRALVRNPDQRYKSARAMQADLLAAEPSIGLEGTSILCRPKSLSVETHSSTVIGRSTISAAPSMARPRLGLWVALAIFAALAVVIVLKLVWPGGSPEGTAAQPAATLAAGPPPAPPGGPAPAPWSVPPAPAAPATGGKPDAGGSVAPAAGDAAADAAPATAAVKPAPGSAAPAGAPGPDAGGGAVGPAAGSPPPPPSSGGRPAGSPAPGPRETTPPDEPRPLRLVHLSFPPLPPGAVVVVAGRRVDPRVGADVPWSQAPVTIVVTVPGGQYDPWTGLIVPTADGPVRPELRLRPPATAGAGSSGSSPAVPQGPDGGTTRAGGPAGADAGSVASSTQPPRTGTSSADAGDGRPTGRLGTSIMTQWGD